MRLTRLEDTARLIGLMANVAFQDVQREDHKDIHDDEWILSWLKSKGTVELTDDVARKVKKRASHHRWDEATDEIYIMITRAGKELRVPKPGDRLQLCMIDRRVTSPKSPEGNGLTERVVKTIKFCFKKMALEKGLDWEWDELLWSLSLGYNAARQQSTKVSPFNLLFAQKAVVPPDLKGMPAMDFEKDILDDNDTQKPRTGMKVATKPAILKLVKVQKDGVVMLEDSTRLREKSTMQNIAPCHLQVKDQYDCSRAVSSKHPPCEVCRRTDGEASMLLCDACNRGYYIWCLTPALKHVPGGDWRLCPRCPNTEAEVSAAEMEEQSLVEKMGKMKLNIKEKLGFIVGIGADARLLAADVGPMRIVKKDAGQPWPASTKEQLVADEGRMGDLPDRIEWGEQGSLAEVVKKLMPGHLHEGHRTILSRKCSEQQARAKELRHAEKVPAMTKEEIEKRGNYRAWRKKYGVCDAVVTSPWFAVLDIALPLAVLASKKIHVGAGLQEPAVEG
ncbi:hypothetical protein CYMTET_12630 [Cymbomonas tetramitiformis]|uniref:Integrase catalytic domain-containing protein n=1 Tax=Cymbomonas tetramitiformis TaxID=36881 RepID=A0AAE0GJN5_9CHLO|nr:hypothetical protein CYMTET_12630 [Cymbomonas tetramitiformis]